MCVNIRQCMCKYIDSYKKKQEAQPPRHNKKFLKNGVIKLPAAPQ